MAASNTQASGVWWWHFSHIFNLPPSGLSYKRTHENTHENARTRETQAYITGFTRTQRTEGFNWGALTDSCADSKHLYRTELTARLLSDQVCHLFCQGTWFSIQNGEYWILYRCLYLALPIYDSRHWLPLLPLSVLVKLMLHLSEVGSMCLTTWQLKAAGWTHWCI